MPQHRLRADLTPLRTSRDFRLLYVSRTVIALGTQATEVALLVQAGAADMVSGIFRDTLWNQTIPDRLRGRMAGLELLSYGVGPSAGQIRAGAVASVTSARFSLASGGLFCAGAVGLVCLAVPGFTRYRAQAGAPAQSSGQ